MRDNGKEIGKIFTVSFHGKIIGGSCCLFSDETVYLLFSGGMRKSYPLLYPGVLAVWNAMLYSREKDIAISNLLMPDFLSKIWLS